METNEPVLIVGLGLVGAFTTILLSHMNYKVTCIEKRSYSDTLRESRSLMLAISNRARLALRMVPGLEEKVINASQRIYGRVIHRSGPFQKFEPYDMFFLKRKERREALYFISRSELQVIFFDYIRNHFPHVWGNLRFNTSAIDFHQGCSILTSHNQVISYSFLIAADGHHSVIREKLKIPLVQIRSSIKYKEVQLEKLAFAKEPFLRADYLHFWPDPEKKSLLMAFIKDVNNGIRLINLTFFYTDEAEPDSVPMELKERPESQFLETLYPLEVYCREKQVLLVGDAAHTVLPFYGQGLNAGLEDLLLISPILGYADQLGKYSQKRVSDSKAICRMAINHSLRIFGNSPNTFISSLEYQMVAFYPQYSYTFISKLISCLTLVVPLSLLCISVIVFYILLRSLSEYL